MLTASSSLSQIAADLAIYERAMRELLQAADRNDQQPLSEPAASALALAARVPEARQSSWPAIYRHAARYLRERCIRLGVPRSRYVGGEWLRLGL